MEKLPVLIGPTAVGKTSIAIKLAKAMNAEIVSADSMQIYRGMDIGTAKPSMDERQGVPHHLIDLVDPDDLFTVADYQERFEEIVLEIRQRGKIPLVTGGTGLYVRAVTRRFKIPAPTAHPGLRQTLQKRAEREGGTILHMELERIDPISAARIHPNDRRRVIRALEVYHSSGKPFSFWLENAEERLDPGTVIIGLQRDRDELYQRINARVDSMIEQGLLEEVRSLLKLGYDPNLPSMQGLGYKELIPVIEGAVTLEEALELLKRRTRNYAKRQMSWFRREPTVWFDIHDDENNVACKILSFFEGRFRENVE